MTYIPPIYADKDITDPDEEEAPDETDLRTLSNWAVWNNRRNHLVVFEERDTDSD